MWGVGDGGGRKTLVCQASKYVPDRFHHQSRPKGKAMYHPSRDVPLLRSQG